MSKIRATFNSDGFATGFYPDDIWPDNYPNDAVEISHDDYVELLSYHGLRKYVDGRVVEYAPPPPSPSIPQVVSRFQARAALYGAGLLDDVETAIAAADPLVQMAWADAQEFQRNSPTILSLAAVLGLFESDVDELFIAASEIVA